MRSLFFYIGGALYLLCRKIWSAVAPLALMAA